MSPVAKTKKRAYKKLPTPPTPIEPTWQPTPEQALCRDLMHNWTPISARRDDEFYVRVLLCERCGAQKEQWFDEHGYPWSHKMHYPEGYLRPEGRMTRADRAQLRLGNMDA